VRQRLRGVEGECAMRGSTQLIVQDPTLTSPSELLLAGEVQAKRLRPRRLLVRSASGKTDSDLSARGDDVWS
jgi:hypothetical protein